MLCIILSVESHDVYTWDCIKRILFLLLFWNILRKYFLKKGLAMGTVVFNLLVFVLLITKKRNKRISVFDKVIIGHSIVDGLTGLGNYEHF